MSRLLLLGLALLAGTSVGVPIQDSPRQRLLNGLSIPPGYRGITKPKDCPYDYGCPDKWDSAIDSVGEHLNPLPWRNKDGATVLGPWNKERSRQNPDIVRSPSTDQGDMANMRWSFADSHIRIQPGGWTRQTTVRELPTSKQLAGVNMRLGRGVIRELHWHQEAEWAYILAGEARITGLDYEGHNFINDLKKGDLWYFPSGVPHSIQGIGEEGTEFLLIFDDGNASEETTFLLTDWLAHTPKSVLAKNFNLHPEVFENIPKQEKYIFKGRMPGSIEEEEPRGKDVIMSKQNFTHNLLGQTPIKYSGGEARIVDSRNFPISKTVAAAHLIIEPGAMREMHWHPNADEWTYIISGRARVTVFAAQGTARTFDYVAGDVGIVPRNMGHYVENIADEPLEMLEIFRSDEFRDVSLFRWMGDTPKKQVVDTLFHKHEEDGDIFWDSVKGADNQRITKPNYHRDPPKDDDRREEM